MRQASGFLVLALVAHAYSAPQFITWKDGKIGVNFGGYSAGVGFGANGGNGGLYAGAGTPYGQSAAAGLGGAYGTKGGGGGLFVAAQAAENIQASAGLGGLAGGNGYATGNGFAAAQAGGHAASSGLGGQSSAAGSTGYKVQSFGIPATVIKEVSVVPVENKPSYTEAKKVHKEVKFEAENEVRPFPLSSGAETHVNAKVDIHAEAQPPTVLVKEVYVEPQTHVIEKTKIRTHYKPHHHHVHKTAYIGGYVGGGANIPPPSYTSIQKRVDVGVQGSENVGVIDVGAHGHGGAQTTITKEVSVGHNPSFFTDIFNIPISALQAVGGFLSNSAANTKVSVQKSASVQGDSDTTSSKHAPFSSSSSSLSDTQISVETPSVSQLIDGIFSIPINTLGAVNKFLENNITGRKRIQVREESGEPTRVRLGPHARRRANKVIYVQQEPSDTPKPEEAH